MGMTPPAPFPSHSLFMYRVSLSLSRRTDKNKLLALLISKIENTALENSLLISYYATLFQSSEVIEVGVRLWSGGFLSLAD